MYIVKEEWTRPNGTQMIIYKGKRDYHVFIEEAVADGWKRKRYADDHARTLQEIHDTAERICTEMGRSVSHITSTVVEV